MESRGPSPEQELFKRMEESLSGWAGAELAHHAQCDIIIDTEFATYDIPFDNPDFSEIVANVKTFAHLKDNRHMLFMIVKELEMLEPLGIEPERFEASVNAIYRRIASV